MEFILMIHQEQEKRNRHKSHSLIRQPPRPCLDLHLALMGFTASPPTSPEDTFFFFCFCMLADVQHALIQDALCCCASLEKKTTHLTVFKVPIEIDIFNSVAF